MIIETGKRKRALEKERESEVDKHVRLLVEEHCTEGELLLKTRFVDCCAYIIPHCQKISCETWQFKVPVLSCSIFALLFLWFKNTGSQLAPKHSNNSLTRKSLLIKITLPQKETHRENKSERRMERRGKRDHEERNRVEG